MGHGYDGNKNGKADWMEFVEIAKELGFKWGGDWEQFATTRIFG